MVITARIVAEVLAAKAVETQKTINEEWYPQQVAEVLAAKAVETFNDIIANRAHWGRRGTSRQGC